MKFAEHLSAHITPEWRKQYIQYETMKEMIYNSVEEAPSAEATDQELISRYFAKVEENFFQYSDKELLKINTFFSEKLAEASRKFATLKSELTIRTNEQIESPSVRKRRNSTLRPLAKQPPSARKIHDLKLAFSEFYLSLILLQNYQTLNFTGFRKILKKFDKELHTSSGAKWRIANVETAPFYTTKQVDQLIKETESVFTTQLEGGNRQKAMKRLRVPPLGQEQNPWTTFRVGLFAGCFIVMVVTVVIAANFVDSKSLSHSWVPALHIYRGTFLIILCCFLLGLNTYGWRSSGVNHVLIFELDPRHHLNHQQLLEVSCFFSVIWSISVLCFLFSHYISLPMFVSPLALVTICLLLILNPFRVFYYKARFWLLKVLFRIVTAPFHHVGFADFWLADQLNSLNGVLLDFEYMICFYTAQVDWLGKDVQEDDSVCGTISYGVRPIVACLPAWFRFAQCLRRYRDTRLIFPHIINAGKYSTTFFVVLFDTLNKAYKNNYAKEYNAFFYLFIIAKVISTCYTLTWDIKMDWGLLDSNAGENKYLREEVVYASKYYYYFAIIEDVLLRFKWVVAVILVGQNIVHTEIVSSIMASLEVFRRFIWNFFRLENEHLNNCGQFRAVRDISIAPIDADDQAQLENMMDEDDGVTNRNRGDNRRLITNRSSKKETKILVDKDDDDDEEDD